MKTVKNNQGFFAKFFSWNKKPPYKIIKLTGSLLEESKADPVQNEIYGDIAFEINRGIYTGYGFRLQDVYIKPVANNDKSACIFEYAPIYCPTGKDSTLLLIKDYATMDAYNFSKVVKLIAEDFLERAISTFSEENEKRV